MHALQWLIYGLLQEKQFQEAYKLAKTMSEIAKDADSPLTKFHYALIRGAYILESKDWQANLIALDMKNLGPSSQAVDVYTNALIKLHQEGNHADLSPYLKELEKIIQSPKSDENYFSGPVQNGVEIAKIIYLQLQAKNYLRHGKIQDAIKLLRKALLSEELLTIGYGPPVPIQPSRELLAEILFENHQYQDSYLESFNQLKSTPNRTISKEALKRTISQLKQKGLALPERMRPYFIRLLIDN